MRRRHIAAQREGVFIDFAGFGTAANPGSWRTPAVVVCPCSGSFLTDFTETAPGGASPCLLQRLPHGAVGDVWRRGACAADPIAFGN